MGGGGGSWLECVGESGSAEGVVIFGVGGPRGLRDCTTLSTRERGRTVEEDVLRVRVARVGEISPSSFEVAIDALRDVKLKGR